MNSRLDSRLAIGVEPQGVEGPPGSTLTTASEKGGGSLSGGRGYPWPVEGGGKISRHDRDER